MEIRERHEHDVLVIGAGGAGLRAAIAAIEGSVSVGIVCKSLLGKAHTVMAEGGVATALGNVRSEDNWKVHFRDTMRGGNFRVRLLSFSRGIDRGRPVNCVSVACAGCNLPRFDVLLPTGCQHLPGVACPKFDPRSYPTGGNGLPGHGPVVWVSVSTI